jgi:hypothetical protein
LSYIIILFVPSIAKNPLRSITSNNTYRRPAVATKGHPVTSKGYSLPVLPKGFPLLTKLVLDFKRWNLKLTKACKLVLEFERQNLKSK